MLQTELSLDEIKKVSLDIMIKVTQVCNKQNIIYFLGYGTLLGAVRHKGFIPWDDDIDLLLPREDYNRLAEYFIAHEKELYPFKLFSLSNNEKYPYTINRICNVDYVIHTNNETDCGMGIFIDLYPLDGLGKTYKEAKKKKKRANIYSSLCFLATRNKYQISFTKGKVRQLLKRPAFIYAHMWGKDHFVKKMNETVINSEYNNSKYIGNMVCSPYRYKDIFLKKWFKTAIDVEFEGHFVKAPAGYHEYLTHVYGDYMVWPPEGERFAHHYYKAYRK